MKALDGIFPLGSLKITKAGSLCPDEHAAKATVEPCLAQSVLVICTVAAPATLLVLLAGLSMRTMVWSTFAMLYGV